MGFYEELEAGGYMVNGAVSCKPGEDCDNPYLFSVVAYMISRDPRFTALLCTRFLNENKAQEGINYFRKPGKLCSHDELIALSSIVYSIALQIVVNGRFACYGPFPKFWFIRFPFLFAFCAMRVGRDTLLDRVIWSLWAFFTGLSGKQNTSSKQLYVVMSWSLQRKVPYMIRRQYKGPKELFEIYYKKEHPITKNAEDTWKN